MAHQRGNEQSSDERYGWDDRERYSNREEGMIIYANCERVLNNIISIFAFLNYCIQNCIQLSVTRRDKTITFN